MGKKGPFFDYRRFTCRFRRCESGYLSSGELSRGGRWGFSQALWKEFLSPFSKGSIFLRVSGVDSAKKGQKWPFLAGKIEFSSILGLRGVGGDTSTPVNSIEGRG